MLDLQEQTAKPGSKLERILDQIRAAEAAKDPYRPMWLLNQCFYDGLHEYYLDDKNPTRLRTLRDDQDDWRSTVSVNLFRLICDTTVAKLTQNRPVADTEPVHNDWRSMMKARASRKIADYIWDSNILQEKLYDVARFMWLHGAGWWAPYWDPDAGEEIGIGEDGKPIRAGAAVIHALTNFDVGFDPMAKSPDDAMYCYRSHYLPVATIKKLTGKTVEAEGPEMSGDRLAPDRAFSPEIQDLEIGEKLGYGSSSVWEFYDLANKKMYWLTRNQILKTHDWTLGNPFVGFFFHRAAGRVEGGHLVAGNLYGSTVANDVRACNAELNAVLSQAKDIRRLTMSPRYFMVNRNNVDKNTLSAKPGSFIEIKDGAQPPQRIDPQELSGSMREMFGMYTDYTFRVAGINETTEGRSAGSLQSGRGAGIMAELDAGRFAPVAANISKGINQAILIMLRLWHEFSPDATLAALVGPNAGMDLATWSHDDVNLFNIRIREGSTFARSKTMRRQDILEAVQLGIFTSPSAVKKALEFDDIEEVEGDANAQRMCQRREIEKMILMAQEVAINPFDDHEIHADETKMVLLSPDYETFDQGTKDRLLNHWMMHTQQMAQQMQAIQQGAQGLSAAGGSPAGQGPQVSMHKGVPQGEGAPLQ